jgi:hypothetical protein
VVDDPHDLDEAEGGSEPATAAVQKPVRLMA